MAPRDLKELAREKFRTPDFCTGSMDIIGRYADDIPRVNATILDAVRPERPDARICELGFGTGWLLEEMRDAFPEASICGLDLSEALVAQVREDGLPRVDLLLGDMERLPFADASFDVVATCWTLYFLRDIDAAFDGIVATLRPGGKLVAATVAPDHMIEFHEAAMESFRIGVPKHDREDHSVRFDLDSGAPYMRRHLRDVEVREWHGALRLPDVATALRLWEVQYGRERSGEPFQAARDEMERLLSDWHEREGTLEVRRHGGLFVGRRA